MTALPGYLPREPLALRRGWVEASLLAIGLASIVTLRWAATIAGLDGLAVGMLFGAALLALGAIGGARDLVGRPSPRSILAGLAFGLALVGVAWLGPLASGAVTPSGLGRPAAPFVPWALVTVVVASAEEAILRGVLFGRLMRAGGTVLALAVTTVLFALLHVPLYGWHVVPLDLAVGLGLGGLRLSTRGIAAPAAAHVVADLATWWL
jgi:membrane protease YdiL (CAAX protease family)